MIFLSRLVSAAKMLHRAKPPISLTFSLTRPVNHLNVADIQRRMSLKSARRIGGRFLILDEKKTVAAVELADSVGKLAFSQLEEGPFAKRLERPAAC